jgi:hypothetical protein
MMAIDKIKDSKLTYNQKIQVIGKVMDSLGVDKGEFNKMSSKLKGTMESVNEANDKLMKVGSTMTLGGNNLLKPVKMKLVSIDYLPKDGKYSYKFQGGGRTQYYTDDVLAKKLKESVTEGVSSTDMDKIKGAVEAAKSFMSVGAELKKLGMKYTFATEPLPIYIIQPTPNNRVAIVNKKYASKPDFVVGDIAVGIMESKSPTSVNEGRAFINAARKAKNEGLTEFEFNGKKYPVTIKD